MPSKARQRKIRLPDEIDEKMRIEAENAGISFNEAVVCAVGYYLGQSEGQKELWFDKFTRLDMSLEALDLRIKGITTMLLYFIQTFFYTHPELKDGYDEDTAYKEASRMSKEWFNTFVNGIGNTNMNFMKELRAAIIREHTVSGGADEK